MQCPICRQEIKDDVIFCGRCGNQVPRCPACRKVIRNRIGFCIYDGTPIPEELVSKLPDEQENFKRKKQKKKKPWILKMLFLLVLCAALILAALFAADWFLKKRTKVSAEMNAVISEKETEEEAEENKITQESETEVSQSMEILDIGDTCIWGTYEQDNDLSNGQEAIEWIVLDKKDGMLLVISKYALDCQPYSEKHIDEVTWETCTLRQWLNDDFYNTAFSEKEKSMIPEVTVTADANPSYGDAFYYAEPGNDTKDRVFLLSIKEAENYFSSSEERACQPTAYTIAQNVEQAEFGEYSVYKEFIGNCGWWLRTSGHSQIYASYVHGFGEADTNGEYMRSNSYGVRPAMWIKTEEVSEAEPNEYQEEVDISDQLIQSIESAANGKSVYSIVTDYDADGTTEVFAIIGSADENDELFGSVYTGEIWFANPYEAYRISETDIYYADSVDILEFDQTKFFVAEKAVMTGGYLYMWGTENSKAVETPISGEGCSIHTIERVSEKLWTFTVEQSAYDGSADGAGHTWKPYYFYWDGEMHEYGGYIITAEEFCAYGGAEEILNEITAAGNTYTDIIYRGNGLIHINYHSPEGFNENATLRLENGNVQLLAAYSGNSTENLLGASYGGVYASAMLPEIATYP